MIALDGRILDAKTATKILTTETAAALRMTWWTGNTSDV